MVTATYWCYHTQETTEFDGFDEAIRFLAWGEEDGRLAAESVTDGKRSICDPELSELMWAALSGDYKSQDFIDADCEEEFEPVALLPARAGE